MSKFILTIAAVLTLLGPSLAFACPAHAEGEKPACACAAKKEKACCEEKKAEGECACKKGKGKQAAAAWNPISVEDLTKLREGESKVTVFDVNPDSLRKNAGVIPGAILLSSSSGYELSQLPAAKDEKLVFYCANTRCTAAHEAAERALAAGHSDVNVLSTGIKGWKEAGQSTSQPKI